MVFTDGKAYTVRLLSRGHRDWPGVAAAVARRTRKGTAKATLSEVYEVKWRTKPFPWSWTKEFRPHRRWFYHGTTGKTIQMILNKGFEIPPPARARTGRMLGNGVYLTYHTAKGKRYGTDGYVLSVMVYTPNRLVKNPGQTIDQATIRSAATSRDAIEVRTGAIVMGHTMLNHEICVYDTRRVVPRFILRFT